MWNEDKDNIMKTLIALFAISLIVSCSGNKTTTNQSSEIIGKTANPTLESTINEINYNNDDDDVDTDVDTLEIVKRAKKFFNQYINKRLAEIDPDGFASEYDESREYYVGDINLDNIPDAIVLYTIEGVGGGNNWERHIVMLINDGKEFDELNHTIVYGTLEGEGTFIGIENGYVLFDKLEYNSTNTLEKLQEGTPTKYRRVGYGIRGNNIVIDEIK